MASSCSLFKHLKDEHEVSDIRYTDTIVGTCPVIGKQICLWCCLHIDGLANPARRNNQVDSAYEFITPELTKMDWDEIWKSCSVCKIKQ